MTLIELDDGGPEPVSPADVKAWCRIDRADEDDLIEALIAAARETIERDTRLALARRGFRLALARLPADRRLVLPRRPLVSVTAIKAFDANGTERSLSPGEAVVERFGTVEALRLSEMAATLGVGGLTVDIVAGFAAGAVPEDLKLALKRIVAAAYETRAPGAGHPSAGAVPMAAREAMAAYREVRF